MPKAPIEFWFDFASGYAYFAAATIDELGERHGRTVVWRPYMLGVAFKQTGVRGLSATPMKGDYARRDWARLARQTGLAFSPPANHPITALPASRAYYWVEQHAPDKAHDFARAAFHAYFADAHDLTAPASVAALGGPLELPVAELEAGISSEPMKAKVKAASDEAIAKGVFGSPFFLVDGEPFWGFDRMPMLEAWLETGGW
ncbi:MAG: 2-hydroxychromene-2-carboxylate isomerase [Hyphomicrobiales bacterium]|nr:2-hydroxychromene-2-carboxylate isomerase [Hyphomicrobiales bacterium]